MSRSSANRNPFKHKNALLNLERLEDRTTPSCNAISGYVYHDANNDGHFNDGETPIANSTVELREADTNKLIDTTTTNANGYYEFSSDPTHPGAELTTAPQVVAFPLSSKFHQEGTILPFDTSLGKLVGVEIIHEGTISSEIEVENVSPDSHTEIDGIVSGTMTLTAPGVNDTLSISGQAGTTFHATPFDDDLDYRGGSGTTFGTVSVTESNAPDHAWVTDEDDLAAYTGTSPITLKEDAIATTHANSEGGGDLNTQIRSKTSAKLTVIYHYVPVECLEPGDYKIIQTEQPDGFIDGKEEKDGDVIPNSNTTDVIRVTLDDEDLVNNNFGEIKPLASIAGHVYVDANNDGIRQASEAPIPGTTVTLTGFDTDGPVSKDMATNNLGEFKFADLKPGTYALTEGPTPGFDDGKDKVGSQGGTLGNDVFSDINLTAGTDGINNDFGEIRPDQPGSPLPKNVGPLGGLLPIVSKIQLTTSYDPSMLDPVLRGQMAFVVGTTISLTGQQPNASQVMAGVHQLQNGVSQSAIIAQLWASDAHRAIQADALYQDVLNRAPTAQERADTIQALNTGATELEVKEQLFVSPEYQQLHPTTDALVLGLYEDILNKIPGTQATEALLQSMDNEPLNDVVHGLLVSDESLASLIDDAYRQTVRRAATSAEIATWTAPIKAGTMTLDDLSQRLLGSQEFYELAFASVR